MDKLCLSVLNYYKSQIVSLWSIRAVNHDQVSAVKRVIYQKTRKAGSFFAALCIKGILVDLRDCLSAFLWLKRHGSVAFVNCLVE
ncbi:MAG: hypothetical protein B6D35_11980 [Candidatus Brocadia sp. UTAMX2]|nr:MAG: hypothetical protein B6D35_11980 [Candidatus Brocadia sp. UTAMX2]